MFLKYVSDLDTNGVAFITGYVGCQYCFLKHTASSKSSYTGIYLSETVVVMYPSVKIKMSFFMKLLEHI